MWIVVKPRERFVVLTVQRKWGGRYSVTQIDCGVMGSSTRCPKSPSLFKSRGTEGGGRVGRYPAAGILEMILGDDER